MKKILFDASVHLGQFDIQDNSKRIWCKNSQISISNINAEKEVQAYYTYNENGWMDAIIWSLDRQTQDTFYPFMDVFYSVKQIEGLPFNSDCLNIFTKLKSQFSDVEDSNLLSSAVAIENDIDEIHSTYNSFNNLELIDFLKGHNIQVCIPNNEGLQERTFSQESNLELLYQDAYSRFKEVGMNPIEKFHL